MAGRYEASDYPTERGRQDLTNKQTSSMANKHIKYSPSATKVGFSAQPLIANKFGENFADFVPRTALEQTDIVHIKANNCRDWFKPVFADEANPLPVSNPCLDPCAPKTNAVVVASTEPPAKQEEADDFWKYLFYGAAIFVAYKLLS